MAETANCTEGMGITKNNCFGIMTWPNGVRTGKTYASPEESYEDFKRIWSTYYVDYPSFELADKWTGSDHVQDWLDIVNYYY
jgi:hypothetical protein